MKITCFNIDMSVNYVIEYTKNLLKLKIYFMNIAKLLELIIIFLTLTKIFPLKIFSNN